MQEPSPPTTPDLTELRARLLACAELLRGAEHLEPETQEELADLVIELAGAIDPSAPSERAAHLAETSAHLIKALHEQHGQGLLTTAKRRLEEAAARAEAEAPVATGVALKLVDALAGIGV